MKDLVELQKSTKLLREIYNSNVSAVRKFEILEQVYANLQVLKKEMKFEDYHKEFSKLEASVNSIVDNLTSKSFLDELLKKINKLPIFSAK
jgi:hypothetical protein